MCILMWTISKKYLFINYLCKKNTLMASELFSSKTLTRFRNNLIPELIDKT